MHSNELERITPLPQRILARVHLRQSWSLALAPREIDLTDDADLEAAIEQIAYYSGEPSADAGAIPLWSLAKLTAGKVTVALSGEGADELFAGYLTYQADRYAAAAPIRTE